ncbi:DUF3168 domain-containing protein [Sphingomonas abaci]|uniref:DUF3168 domain-containing protein n=1 Tax=Sphingomonas abaci TaxID=237611 RepID=A0A7W7EWT8_9SPHN|nr:DUF3168 domain-containing protein [Sphingomonas abaci]MBB4616908.1 hypothetical protein [Sphingomonas abaci]
MAIDSTLNIRRAARARLLASEAVTLIVGNRVYGQTPPKDPPFPFTLWGAITLTPLRASCLDGSEGVVAVHGFAKKREEDGREVEWAEDHASRLGAAIAAALDGYLADIPGGTAAFRWTGSQLLVDGGDSDAFHTVQNFRIRCMTSQTV